MGDVQVRWTDAWQQLVYERTPFRAVDSREFQDLIAEASRLEQLFLSTPALRAYTEEWRPRVTPAAPAAAVAGAPPAGDTLHAAAIQLQLMENAFFSLRLDRHANAPDNRGWMNLFRRWAGSPTFQAHVRELESTFSLQFVEFYFRYIEGWPADLPIPHPWDVDAAARVSEAYGGVTAEAVQHCVREAPTGKRGKGIFLDPGRVEAGPPREVEEPMPVREEQHGTSSQASASALPPPASDSSDSTD